MIEKTESRTQAEIFQHHWNTYPKERGLLFMVHNTPKNKIDGARLKAMGMVSGVSDLIYLSPNGVVAVEVKTKTGKQSKRQVEWQKSVESIGIRYEVVRGIEDFEKKVLRNRKSL